MRWLRGLLWIVAATGAFACDDEDEITGTYRANFFESRDTCDDSRDNYPVEIEITRQAGEFRAEVNGAGPLTGDLDEEGFLVLTGTVTSPDGTRPREVQLEMDIRRGRIVEGKGRISWDGTFPEVPGLCVQEFDFTGFRRDAVAPILG